MRIDTPIEACRCELCDSSTSILCTAYPYKLWLKRTEYLSDLGTGCATVAEVRKRGKDFWAEFEFYLSDLLVGLVMDVVLVSLMAPVAVLGAKPRSRGTSSESPSLVLARCKTS